MAVDEEKQRVRATLLAARRARTADEIECVRAAIRAVILPRCAGLGCVAAYEPMRGEPASVQLLAAVASAGTRVLVPVVLPDRDLSWARWAPDGSGEPLDPLAIEEAELVIVPALAVATDGTRLGRGGGSYDRVLRRTARGVPVAALVYDDEVLPSLPHSWWDVPVSAAVTPSGWRELGRNTDVVPDR
jgi:5-formyltetrahydrofolate cyclo-ligase